MGDAKFQGFADSDWAGDRRDMKSTSGGTIMWGSHCLKAWSTSQSTVALSSGEAELKATCKGLTEALGLREVLQFLYDEPCGLRHCTDASACVGMLRRAGAGRVKHLTVRQLWCQEVFRLENTCTEKIPRADSPADLMCSNQTVEGLRTKLAGLGFATAH